MNRINANKTMKLVFFSDTNGPEAAQAGLDKTAKRRGVI
jgi:hypothetical protein